MTKLVAILALLFFSVVSPRTGAAQTIPFELKLGQSRQQAIEVLKQQGIQPDFSDKLIHFRGECGSINGFWSVFFSDEGVWSVNFTTGTVSPKQKNDFLRLVPLVEGCYRILDSNLRRAHGSPIADGQLSSKKEFDSCFSRDGILIQLKAYKIGAPEQYTVDVREPISAMRGKVARVSVKWTKLRRELLPPITMSDQCAAAVNRLVRTN